MLEVTARAGIPKRLRSPTPAKVVEVVNQTYSANNVE
jgi:hypothetical protein